MRTAGTRGAQTLTIRQRRGRGSRIAIASIGTDASHARDLLPVLVLGSAHHHRCPRTALTLGTSRLLVPAANLSGGSQHSTNFSAGRVLELS